MWVSKNHPNPPRAPEPVEEWGERLLTLPRGPGQEMRLNRCEYNGVPYLTWRLWQADPAGVFRPTVKGATIRRREAGELARALAGFADAQQAPARDDGPREGSGQGMSPMGDKSIPGPADDVLAYRERYRREPRPWSPDALPRPDGREFDEFRGHPDE
jgi:hypothetical protein